ALRPPMRRLARHADAALERPLVRPAVGALQAVERHLRRDVRVPPARAVDDVLDLVPLVEAVEHAEYMRAVAVVAAAGHHHVDHGLLPSLFDWPARLYRRPSRTST